MGDIAIVGGCGHVGLPLGLAFARAGRRVIAYDTNAARVKETGAGRMPFQDRGADELLPKVLADGTFRCTTDPSGVREADVVIVVIGTPVDEHLNPTTHALYDTLLRGERLLKNGQLLILRSTLYPGTTARVDRMLRRKGLELDVAFCPERVAQGVALEEISSLPQIVAGCSERAQKRAETLFGLLTSQVVPLDPMAAELTKLFSNAWRYIEFAVANQFFVMANEYGIDYYDVRRAMTQDYPRLKNLPGAGFAAGPCLFKDTMQLSAFHNNNFFLGHAAMLVNEGLPNYLVTRVARRFNLGGMTAGILGMTFKGESDDPRDSLAIKLRDILQADCREVLCTDPFLKEPWLTPLEETIARADLLFIGAPHSAYRDLDFKGKPVVDVWNIAPKRLRVL